jgi:TonB family protein
MKTDKVFMLAFGVSLAIHLSLLAVQVVRLGWLTDWMRRKADRTALEVIYEQEALKQELEQLKEQLVRARRDAVSSAAPGASQPHPTIRIPDRPSFAASQALLETAPNRAAIIDLTNLTDASRGDPVLLSYFSAIREQIQRAANEREWLTTDLNQRGLVYVSFILTAEGRVRSATIVSQRSVQSEPLHETALKIINAAAPFPPFPPSLTEQSKTLVVPLEFLLES